MGEEEDQGDEVWVGPEVIHHDKHDRRNVCLEEMDTGFFSVLLFIPVP